MVVDVLSGCSVISNHSDTPFSDTRDRWLSHNNPLDYDTGTAARKMRERGLPAGYADALETGLWPSCDVLPLRERERGTPLAATSLVWNFAEAA